MIKCQFFLVVNDSTFVYTGYEFYPLYGSLLTLKGDKDSKYTFDTRGVDSAYERGGDDRRKFWIKPLKETDLSVAQAFFDP